ncbi:catalase [Paracoccus alcaliphilus]|uniref:Catalase n=1 Tax=Paracoccus alcaliphilus TaxID=34002 RepID=A0A1H8HDQ3_9RHOB|nr:hypothetical protein [Paracoccus alcaliphilus]WCR20800.1 hypothetical protein JHW40_20700 [Paracoccus alcaliphilus]SEN54139.1 catalase [Paracoccus alcaliphilus]
MGSLPVLFDAVALVLTNKAAVKLARVGAGIEPDEGVTDLAALPEAACRRYWDREATVRDLA